MTYIVTARKWRPTTFEEVVGQQHVCATLKNAIIQNRVGHAYIFSGPRGVGKTTVARILARVLNCTQPVEGNPCNTCEPCVEISGGRYVDVFEIDGASNRGVEEIRNLREAVRYAPAKGTYKIYIIDEVHMLTKEAFNALLKTLEEPPSHVLFIFATTEVHKVPPTILSRCQRFDFRRIAINGIIERLRFIAQEEGITVEDDALLFISKKGDGSMRDAQSIFDQVVAYSGTDVTAESVIATLNIVNQDLLFEVTEILRNRDTTRGLQLITRVVEDGYDLREFLSELSEHLRNLLTVVTTKSTELIETSSEYRERYKKESVLFTDVDLIRYLRAVVELERELRWSTQPRLRLESGMVELINMERTEDLQTLLKRIEELKKNSNSSIPIVGTVNAGWSTPNQTKSSAATQPIGTYRTNSYQVKEPEHQRKTITRKLSVDEVFARWDEFISTVKNERINLGSILSQSSLVDVNDGAIKLRCNNEFEQNYLKRNEQFLGEMTHRVFGARTVVQIDLPHHSSDGEKEKPQHPVIEALRRELGAEPI